MNALFSRIRQRVEITSKPSPQTSFGILSSNAGGRWDFGARTSVRRTLKSHKFAQPQNTLHPFSIFYLRFSIFGYGGVPSRPWLPRGRERQSCPSSSSCPTRGLFPSASLRLCVKIRVFRI